AALVINLLWTSKTFVDRIGRLEAYATLLAFNLFPTGFYLVTPYAESATIALMLGAFICLAHERWFASALLVGASTALRPTAAGYALAFGVVAVVAALRRRREGTARWWRPLLAVPLAGWGQIVQLALLQIFVGDATAFFRAHRAFSGNADLQWLRLFDPEFYL